MTDEEFLEDRRTALKESVNYFDSKNKADRERWVCSALAENLGLQYEESEITSPLDDPPDVTFRGASFEVKEVLDIGRRRHAEYKEAYQFALKASSPENLLTDYTPIDMTPTQVGQSIIGKMEGLENRYSRSVKADLDLLFYVNLLDHLLIEGPMPPVDEFKHFGWRSVSAVFGWGALVFYASPDSAQFLGSRDGTLTLKKFD